MLQLTPDEARVLGVLIEKAMTTPDQYPLTQNSAVNGCNQKNNREPVMMMDDGRAFEALEGLRGKGLVVRVNQAGSRVDKFRHSASEVLHARPAELAILAELMLRGPQTLGEIRGRASRMSPFDSLDVVKNLLEAMMTREEPLVKLLPPSPGSRAERYAQLLAPEAHGIDAPVERVSAGEEMQEPGLTERMGKLEEEVAELRLIVERLTSELGMTKPPSE